MDPSTGEGSAGTTPESTTNPAGGRLFRRLLRLDQCRLNEGTFVEFAGRELAVFRMTDPPGVYVLDNACPHANGNLSAGRVKAGVVSCPWHGWKFRLCDGRSAQGSVARARAYPVEVRGEEIYVCLDEA